MPNILSDFVDVAHLVANKYLCQTFKEAPSKINLWRNDDFSRLVDKAVIAKMVD